MEGEASELENLDSELVMSFYDQYHADEISKVYGDLGDDVEDTGVLDLKSSLGCSLNPDLMPQATQIWNLPDLLVGLDSLHRLQSDPAPPSDCIQPSSHANFTHTLELSKSCHSDLRPYLFDNYRHSTDSLLEGLGILPPSIHTPVKSEPSLSSSYHGLDSLELEITPFELNLKSEPGLHPPVTISSICNLSTYSNISGLDILSTSKCGSQLDPLIAQHCTLLPPEMHQGVIIPLPGNRTANFVATVDDITDHPLSDVSQSFLLQDSMKEEDEDCLEKQMEIESNPSYKRCHLCVRIFSTKANLSSHIRHVHLGETKHSRIKSIPCPHCQKMFSRKGHMTEHVRTVHEGKKRIYKEVNCQHCGKTFRRKWGLNIHISSAHADVVSSLLKQ